MREEHRQTPEPKEALPKRQRIAKRADFVRAYEQGQKFFSRYCVVFVVPNSQGHSRIGVTATRKLGKAHIRNRRKRWVREIYRRNRRAMNFDACGCDIVVNLRKSAAAVTYPEFEKDLKQTFNRVIRKQRGPEPA